MRAIWFPSRLFCSQPGTLRLKLGPPAEKNVGKDMKTGRERFFNVPTRAEHVGYGGPEFKRRGGIYLAAICHNGGTERHNSNRSALHVRQPPNRTAGQLLRPTPPACCVYGIDSPGLLQLASLRRRPAAAPAATRNDADAPRLASFGESVRLMTTACAPGYLQVQSTSS